MQLEIGGDNVCSLKHLNSFWKLMFRVAVGLVRCLPKHDIVSFIYFMNKYNEALRHILVH